MQKNTRKKLFGAVLSGVIAAVVLVLLALGILLLWREDAAGGQGLSILLGLCVLMYLAMAAGTVIALVQRWKELKGGEEEDARRY